MIVNGTTVRCFAKKQMVLIPYGVERFIQRYLFPAQFIMGVLGNIVNLFVLLSKDMRSTANDLLAAMACADVALLISMLPHSLAAFQVFAEDYFFRLCYYLSKTHLSALANWFSTAAIWLILAVSIERLLGICSPMHTRYYWKRRHMIGFLFGVFGASGALTFHHHLAYDSVLIFLCNGTQIYGQYFAVASQWQNNQTNPPSQLKQQYLRLSTVANALLVVIIPIAAVTALNIALIRVLKRHDHDATDSLYDSIGKINDASLRQKQERKVTVTVCAIVTCFTLTQGPSAIAFIWELITENEETMGYFYTLISVANNLVVAGKVLNFVLFCLSSAHYRRRLRELIVHRIKRHTPSLARNTTNSYRSRSASIRKLGSISRYYTPTNSRLPSIADSV